ncbi:DUF4133 domain-containing protein [Niabella terrae]
MVSVYQINKGVNQPVYFKGLKAQYIWWLGGGLVVLLMLFAVLYILGIHMYLCLLIIAILGMVLFKVVYRFSKNYGEYGLKKRLDYFKMPRFIINRSRLLFIKSLSEATEQLGEFD